MNNICTSIIYLIASKANSMLGPYNTSDSPNCPHIVISVSHRNPLLLLLCPYVIIVMSV